MQTSFITYQSSKIFYRKAGAGKPLVLIHGFGEDGDIWQQQIESLQDHFLLIIPDLPGSGRSELIEDMSMEGMAEVIKAIINYELPVSSAPGGGWVGASIAGHSMGGYITLALTEKYPELLSSIALVHSSAYADSEEKKATRQKAIEFVQTNGAHAFLKTAIPGLFTPTWAADNKDKVDALIEQARGFSNEAITSYYRAMIARPNRTALLKNFGKPVMFIMGEHDQAVPFQQSLQQCYLPHISFVHILRNSAHMGMWEETEKLNQALLQLI